MNDGTETGICRCCGVSDIRVKENTALGHQWDEGKITTEATTESEGERVYTCERCKAQRSESIPKLPVKKDPENKTDEKENPKKDTTNKDDNKVEKPGKNEAVPSTVQTPERVKSPVTGDHFYIESIFLLLVSGLLVVNVSKYRKHLQ